MRKRGMTPVLATVLLILIIVVTGILILSVKDQYNSEEPSCEEKVDKAITVLEELHNNESISEEAYKMVKDELT